MHLRVAFPQVSAILLMCLLLLRFSLISAQTHVPPPPVGGITVRGVIALTHSRVSDETIIAQIEMRPQPFNLSPDELLQLKSNHVSKAVMDAMLPVANAGGIAPLFSRQQQENAPTQTMFVAQLNESFAKDNTNAQATANGAQLILHSPDASQEKADHLQSDGQTLQAIRSAGFTSVLITNDAAVAVNFSLSQPRSQTALAPHQAGTGSPAVAKQPFETPAPVVEHSAFAPQQDVSRHPTTTIQPFIASTPVARQSESLTDDEVNAAIQRGYNAGRSHQIGLRLVDQQEFFLSGLLCTTCQASGYVITVYTPEQWIEQAAHYARREMAPFTLADVADEMRGRMLHVVAMPSTPAYLNGNGFSWASSVHRVVLSDTSRTTTIQPVDLSHGSIETNSAFRSANFTSATVSFFMADVDKLRAADPKGEFFIVVVGDNKNKFFKVKARYMSELFPTGYAASNHHPTY